MSQWTPGVPAATDLFPFVADPGGTPSNEVVDLSGLGSVLSPYVTSALPWTQVIDDDGSSLANWTQNNGVGTWAASGGTINQTNASPGGWSLLFTDAASPHPRAMHIFEAEFKVGTGVASGLCYKRDGATTGDHLPVFYLDEGSHTVKAATFSGSQFLGNGSVIAPTAGTWYKLRVVAVGSSYDLYANGVFVASVPAQDASGWGVIGFGLTSTGTVNVRNIKAWEPDLNLPA